MKQERTITAERPLAQHCAELVRTAPGQAELATRLDAALGRLARALVPALAPLTGGKGLAVKPRVARATTAGELALLIPGLAASSLLALGEEALPLLVSLDAAAVLRMIDRTFGGRGTVPEPLPAEFPGSADLLIGRLESLLIAALAGALGLPEGTPLAPLRRAGLIDELAPFPGEDSLVVAEIEVAEAAGDSWLITLALPPETLTLLFAGTPPVPQAGSRRPADPLGLPFADLPLELTAVLVDMRMSMRTLAALRPGTVLPVAVARQVPLRIGDPASPPVTLATGTVGAAEDRVALQITSAF